MKVLGIETSCDETAVAIVENGIKILSQVVASSADLHIETGGIIPENAARKQVEFMIPVLQKTMEGFTSDDIQAIAVTAGGPGLIGSMLVGVETAKALALVWKKPIVPVPHLLAHVYANWLNGDIPKFPALVLTVAGGHTDLILMKDHGKFEIVGGTRDDAAGETFDKAARLIGLPYPGGPSIQKEADLGDPNKVKLPRPMIGSHDFDFSFSGLKTAIAREVSKKEFSKADIAASVQEAIADILTRKTIKAAEHFKVKNILVAGGVAANSRLRELLTQRSSVPVFIPPIKLCTDNATFIASYAYFNFHPMKFDKIDAIPDPIISLEKYANFKN